MIYYNHWRDNAIHRFSIAESWKNICRRYYCFCYYTLPPPPTQRIFPISQLLKPLSPCIKHPKAETQISWHLVLKIIYATLFIPLMPGGNKKVIHLPELLLNVKKYGSRCTTFHNLDLTILNGKKMYENSLMNQEFSQ